MGQKWGALECGRFCWLRRLGRPNSGVLPTFAQRVSVAVPASPITSVTLHRGTPVDLISLSPRTLFSSVPSVACAIFLTTLHHTTLRTDIAYAPRRSLALQETPAIRDPGTTSLHLSPSREGERDRDARGTDYLLFLLPGVVCNVVIPTSLLRAYIRGTSRFLSAATSLHTYTTKHSAPWSLQFARSVMQCYC
ncbi:hypothetical protein F4859DRAFT_169377 [Xylaria cf. heliscus]|nr:hypothetical protein F4859DRAFT_169377 [Xylaria cf. heliscus]